MLVVGALVAGGVEAVVWETAPRASQAKADTPVPDVTEAATRFIAAQYARSENHPVEVTSERTETNTTLANPDGSWTLNSASQPIRTRRSDGSWVGVDTTLVSDATGVHPKAVPDAVTFSGGGGAVLATLAGNGQKAGLKWLSNLPAPTLDGDTATYPNVASGVDVKMTATRIGFEVSIVLKARPMNLKSVYRLPLTANGLSTSGPDEAGVITLTTGSGAKVGFIRPTVMFDAQIDPGTGDHLHTGPITTAVVTKNGAQELDFTPAAGFLSDPATVYPVTIDPSVHLGEINDMWVGSGGVAGSGANELRVGYYNGNSQTHRSFIKFDTTKLAGTVISSATLALYQWAAHDCTAKDSRIYRLTGAFSDSTTWATQPSTAPTIYASTTDVHGYSGCSADWTRYTVTSLAQSWANGTANYGTLVRQGDETDHTGWWRFDGMDTSAPSHIPSLAVTYNTKPAQPTQIATAPPATCVTGAGRPFLNTLTPKLSAVVSDRDGGTVAGNYSLSILGGANLVTATSPYVNSGGTTNYTVPVGKLTNGGTYVWQVTPYDGSATGTPAATCEFTVDTTAPNAPTVTPTTFAASSWVASGTTGSFAFSDGSSDVASYQYRLDGGPWSGWSATASTGTLAPADGQHTLDVQAIDKAGNLAPTTTVTFGVGAGFTTPHDAAVTVQYSKATSNSPAANPYATYSYRQGSTGGWTIIPTGNVVLDSDGTTQPTWPLTGTVSGNTATYSAWRIDDRALLAGVDGTIQLQACYATTAVTATTAGAGVVCTNPVTVQVSVMNAAAATTGIGPGSLNLATGSYTITAGDVSVASSSDSLSIGRTLTTLSPSPATTGATAVFGPAWTASLTGPSAGAGDLTLTDNSAQGYVTLTDSDGSTSYYTRPTSSSTTFTGIGDADDGSVLTANSASSPTQYTLTDLEGTKTQWANSGGIWQTTSVTTVGGAATSYSYDGTGRVTRILGPVPSGVSSCATLVAGCRALSLTYATGTGAQADDPSGMQDYTGRLVAVDYTAADPASANSMTTIRIARYGYDSTGLLIGQWDPRISPRLVTQYGYATNNRLTSLTPPGLNAFAFGYDAGGKLLTVTRHDDALAADAVTRVVYGVAVNGPTGLPDVTGTTAASWGQTHDVAASATAVFPPDHPASTSPSSTDWPYATLHYLDADSREVNTADYGAGAWQIDSTQYDDNGNTIWSLTAGNRAQALTPTTDTDPYVPALSSTSARATLLATINSYNSDGTELIATLGPAHPILTSGVFVDVRAHTHSVYDAGAPGTGGPYQLVTSSVSSAQSVANTATEYGAITTINGYAAIVSGDPSGWDVRKPTTVTTQMGSAPSSSDLVRTTRYDALGRTIETRLPMAATDGSGNATDSRSTVTSYYTGTGTGTCGSVVLFGSACSTGPAAQPSTGNALPIKTFTYNLYGDPLTVIETAGSTVRTTTNTYDVGDRLSTSGITVTPSGAGGTTVPTVTTGYSSTTGSAVTQSTGSGASLVTLTTGYDSQGRVTSYTDASGTVATTSYDIDGRPSSTNDGKATVSYTYDSSTEHRGLVTSQGLGLGSNPSTMTATYDAAGTATVTYPNGLTANTAADNTGNQTTLAYTKSSITWAAFTQTSDAQGNTVAQSSPNSSQRFGYDNAGRLTQTQDSVTTSGDDPGECITRQYSIDGDSNRTALASYPDAGDAVCTTSTTPSSTASGYDQADRLTNTGYNYDTLGRTTTVPSIDAQGIGSHAAITGALSLGYYTNDYVNTQAQGSSTLTINLDPTQNRVLTSSDGTNTTTNHYDSSSDNPAWTSTSATTWTRYVSGIDGNLAASIDNTGTAVLQLANMHGDIVATAADTTTATGVSSYFESTEYGAPRTPAVTPDTYGWLGAKQRSTNDLAGLSIMGVRLYNPATGRFLSIDPIPGGNDNPYVYPLDPMNVFDLSGRWGWGTALGANNFFSWRPYISAGWSLMHGHFRRAASQAAGGTISTGTGHSAGGMARGYHWGGWRRNLNGARRVAASFGGRVAARVFTWPVAVFATSVDYATNNNWHDRRYTRQYGAWGFR